MNNKALTAKAQSEKFLKTPMEKENNDLFPVTRNPDIRSKDLENSETFNMRSNKETLPSVKHVTIDEEKQNDKIIAQAQVESVNPSDVSKKVLLKCNIIRNKRDGIPVLGRGDGHLSMSDKSLKYIYQNYPYQSTGFHKTYN